MVFVWLKKQIDFYESIKMVCIMTVCLKIKLPIFFIKSCKIRSTINIKLDHYYQYHFENSSCFILTTYQFDSNRLNIKNNYCKLLLFRRYYLDNTIGSGTICYMLLCSSGLPIQYEYVQMSQVLPSSVQRFLHLGRRK